jgi:hypothetical protein
MSSDSEILTQQLFDSTVTTGHWRWAGHFSELMFALFALVLGILCGISCG